VKQHRYALREAFNGLRSIGRTGAHWRKLAVVTRPQAKRGFFLLPRRWVVERDFAWSARFRRLVRDYERLPTVLAGLHFVVFACLMLTQLLPCMSRPSRALGVLDAGGARQVARL
jgi:transposase